MNAVLGRGTCGGHLTLLFTVEDTSEDTMHQGSLGAGICLEDGIEAVARGKKGDFGLNVRFLSGSGNKQMYRQILDLLADEISIFKEYAWDIAIKMSLPASHGFGMSAAGAISSAIAFQRALGLPHEESLRRAYRNAHEVERINSTGLGDVTALAYGGVELRIKPGSPFSGIKLENGPGIAKSWSGKTQLVLAWRSNPGRHTSEYIDNTEWKSLISNAGNTEMEKLTEGEWNESRWNELLDSATSFSDNSKLSSDASRAELMEKATRAVNQIGFNGDVSVMFCMLGESLVILPTKLDNDLSLDRLLPELEKQGLESIISKIGR